MPNHGAMPEETERLDRLDDAIRAHLASLAPGLLDEFPPDDLATAFAAMPPLAPYHARPARFAEALQAAERAGGRAAVEALCRLVMVTLIRHGPVLHGLKLTDELADLRKDALDTILAGVEQPRRGFHHPDNDAFLKDLAVCRGKLLPAGVELIEPHAGIGRRIVTEGGLAEIAPRAWFFLTRMDGFKPFCALHFDRRRIAEFNAAGYAALYRRLAELLALNPAIKGVVSASWWHDPALARISPELGFVDALPRAAGAQVFRSIENAHATADAVRFAPERARLYREGAWQPRVHLLAWPRRDLLG